MKEAKKATNLMPVRKPKAKAMSKHFPHLLATGTAAGLLIYLFFGVGSPIESTALFDTAVNQREITAASIPSFSAMAKEKEAILAQGDLLELSAIEQAEEYLKQNKEALKLQPYHELRAVEFENPLGTRVKFSVFQKGIPVIGMGLELQVSAKGKISVIDNAYRPVKEVALRLEKALEPQAVVEMHRDKYFPLEGTSIAPETSTFLFVNEGSDAPELSYVISMREKGPSRRQVQIVFRAGDGQVLAKHYSRSEF